MTETALERFRGPGVVDWIAGLGCSVLIAGEVQMKGAREMLQSAAAYYFDSPWVPQIHALALTVDAAMIALVMLWLVSPFKRASQIAMTVVAAIGLLLCWAEIVYAVRIQAGAVFVLQQLPFQPVNNFGVGGAQVFASYLIFKFPSGRLAGWRSALVKVGLCVAFWMFQFMVWQMVAPR